MGKINVDMLHTGPLAVNTYIVYADNSSDCAVVDPADAKKVKKYLEKKELVCKAVLLTHSHFDHILGTFELQNDGAKVYIGAEDEAGLSDRRLNLCPRYVPDYTECSGDVLLSGGERIALCGTEFEVVATPGHTRGGVCYVNHENRVIFSGDTLFHSSIGRTDLPGGNFDRLISSVKNRLFSLDGDYRVYPGHESATTLDNERKNNPFVR